uniref:Uncharacterized protein n=1 Tax=Caenorhabditis japonica TaxID=281687 RepID=A0A8R1HUV8_CAEJA
MPNISGCVKRLLPKGKNEKEEENKKQEDVTPSSECDKNSPSTSTASYPYCESFDHLVSSENYEYLRQWGDEDLQRLLEDFQRTGQQISQMLKELEDQNLEARRRKWIEDDLGLAIRKNESTYSRIKLAEQRKENEAKKN